MNDLAVFFFLVRVGVFLYFPSSFGGAHPAFLSNCRRGVLGRILARLSRGVFLFRALEKSVFPLYNTRNLLDEKSTVLDYRPFGFFRPPPGEAFGDAALERISEKPKGNAYSKGKIVSNAPNEKPFPTSLERARLAAKTILDNKGEDVRILDLREITPAFDYFVVGSGVSRRQLHAISEEIDDVFQKNLGDRRNGVDGYQESRWIVLDYGDVVVHLFEPETREFYALEDLWGKGKIVSVEAEADEKSAEPVSSPVLKDESND